MAVDPDRVLKRVQFTKKNYRDLYPALESALVDSQVGKTVIVTGASQGIGKVLQCFLVAVTMPTPTLIMKPTSIRKKLRKKPRPCQSEPCQARSGQIRYPKDKRQLQRPRRKRRHDVRNGRSEAGKSCQR
jgi:hypothetical protein